MSTEFLTDRELFEAVKQNDLKAFNVLYDRYWARMYKKAFYYLNDESICVDILNDIFLNIWRKRDVLNIVTFENYLTAATRYRVYNAIKIRKESRLELIEDYKNVDHFYRGSNDGEVTIHKTEIYNQLDSLLNSLPKRCKQIFLLSRVRELTNAEISSKLSISKRSVENQLSIAVSYLKSHLRIFLIALFFIFSFLY